LHLVAILLKRQFPESGFGGSDRYIMEEQRRQPRSQHQALLTHDLKLSKPANL
jgi:hypothetical protein